MKAGTFIVAIALAGLASSSVVLAADKARALQESANSSIGDEIEVYATILKASMGGETWFIKPLRPEYLARDKARVIKYAEKIITEEKLTGDERMAADNWTAKLYEPHLFTNQLSLPIKWRLVTDKDFISFPKNNPSAWWKAFSTNFPDSRGILTASRVGLSKDGRTAFLSWTKSFGSLGMESAYLVLKKRDGRWHVERVLREIMA